MKIKLALSFRAGVLEAKSPAVKVLDLSVGLFCMNLNLFVLLNQN